MNILSKLVRWLRPGPRIGDRVSHKMTKRRGFVVGLATIKHDHKQRVVTVQYDDGQIVTQQPSEFTVLPRWTRK